MKKKNIIASSLIGLLSSAFALLGMVGVCGFPLLAAFLAWFGIGASQLSVLSKYQSLFTAAAIVALLYGFYALYFKHKTGNKSSACGLSSGGNETACGSASAQSGRFAKIMLWMATLALTATFFMDDNANTAAGENQNGATECPSGTTIGAGSPNSSCSSMPAVKAQEPPETCSEAPAPCAAP